MQICVLCATTNLISLPAVQVVPSSVMESPWKRARKQGKAAVQSTIIFTSNTLTFSTSGSYERPATTGNRIFTIGSTPQEKQKKKAVAQARAPKSDREVVVVEDTERRDAQHAAFQILLDQDSFEEDCEKQKGTHTHTHTQSHHTQSKKVSTGGGT